VVCLANGNGSSGITSVRNPHFFEDQPDPRGGVISGCGSGGATSYEKKYGGRKRDEKVV